MPRRRKDRKDSNQDEIVEELRSKPGISVEVGKDDILCGYQGRTYWYEIKNPNVRGKDGQPRPSAIKDDQKRILREFTGHYKIVFTAEEILEDIGYLPKYGCHIHGPTQVKHDCVFDHDDCENLCIEALGIIKREECIYWRPIS